MVPPARPTLQAIVDQAVLTTAASTGWLLAVESDTLRVVAVSGTAAENRAIGSTTECVGARGFVCSSGQPAALMPRPDDLANLGAGGYAGVPGSVLAVACGHDGAVGVLEVADKHDALPFSFDDIEAVAVLASVAGAALTESEEATIDVPTPAELAAELERLAAADPRRYVDTARLIESLLGQGV